VIDGPTLAVRLAVYASLTLLFGLPMFALYAWTTEGRRAGRVVSQLRFLLVALSLIALIASAVWLVLVAANMAGLPVGAIDRATVQMVVTETPMGAAWQGRMTALVAALVLSAAGRRSPPVALLVAVTTAAAVALGTLAWTGHGAAGGWLQLTADIVHLLAAGTWIGALASFVLLLVRPLAGMSRDEITATHGALRRFSVTGTIVVALLVATGLVNSLMLVGPANLPRLAETSYGQLLIVKLCLFAVMLILAASNRFRLTPALGEERGKGDTQQAVVALRRSVSLEFAAGALVLAVVSALGLLTPPMSMAGS
jgi:putative copper resistance protein D